MQQNYDRFLPDPIERGEAAAEREFDQMLQSDGRLKCACGNLFDPDKEGATLSPDPYAMPFCDSCCEAAFPEFKSVTTVRKKVDLSNAIVSALYESRNVIVMGDGCSTEGRDKMILRNIVEPILATYNDP